MDKLNYLRVLLLLGVALSTFTFVSANQFNCDRFNNELKDDDAALMKVSSLSDKDAQFELR